MALTGVTRPGHIQLRMLDLEAGVRFYRDVLGMDETGRDDQGRVYLKCWHERDHSSIVLREADEAGADFIGFKVLNEGELDRLEAEVKNHGVSTERIPAGDMLETGERVRFQIPSGHALELYATKTMVGSPVGYENPKAWCHAQDRGISPVRLDHCLLYGPDIPETTRFFQEALGFHLTEYVTLPDSDEMGATWLACSNKAHDIAFVTHPEPNKFHHASFLLESWEKVLRASDIMAVYDVPVDMGPTRHGITQGTTIYAYDPSGNRFETFAGGTQNYPDWQPIHWTWEGLGEGGGLDMAQRRLHENFLTIVT